MTLDNIPITTITSLYNAVEYVVQREDKPKEILPFFLNILAQVY